MSLDITLLVDLPTIGSFVPYNITLSWTHYLNGLWILGEKVQKFDGKGYKKPLCERKLSKIKYYLMDI